MHLVNMSPDVHLQKLAFRTGMIKSSSNMIKLDTSKVIKLVQEVFRVAANASGTSPLELDEPAWHAGRLSCSRIQGDLPCEECPPSKREMCLLSSFCKGRRPLSEVCERRIALKLMRWRDVLDSKVRRRTKISSAFILPCENFVI